jgi:hypothetical protein
MSWLRIARFSVLVGASILVIAGCGSGGSTSGSAGPGHGASPLAQGTVSQSPPSGGSGTAAGGGGPAAPPAEGGSGRSPAAEGTGPESPLPRSNGGNSLTVAPMPVGGNADQTGATDVCANFVWLGTLPGTARLSGLDPQISGPFKLADVASACGSDAQQPCQGLTLTAATNSATPCSVGLEWQSGQSGKSGGTVAVSVTLAGTLTCPGSSAAVCQHLMNQLDSDPAAPAQGRTATTNFNPPTPQTSDGGSPPSGGTGSVPPDGTSSAVPVAPSSP